MRNLHSFRFDGLALKTFAIGCLAILVQAGCDLTGDYERKFQKALQESGSRANFDQNLFPTETEIADAGRKPTGVKLRLPKFFDGESKSLAATEARAQPPWGALPGLSYAIERQLDDGNNQWMPVYAYFSAGGTYVSGVGIGVPSLVATGCGASPAGGVAFSGGGLASPPLGGAGGPPPGGGGGAPPLAPVLAVVGELPPSPQPASNSANARKLPTAA